MLAKNKAKSLFGIYKGTSKKGIRWINNIKRHFDALVEPDGREVNTTLWDPNLTMYTHARLLQAYLTKNAYDMSVMNEYDVTPHVNFGTIDNPLLVFSADTTWRYV
jgi:hypothetical protein